MPLCLAGMHRSGTSMIAGILHVCGLDLGPEDDLLPAAPNNPEGFWESRSFLRLNDAILKERGGSWDRPPCLDVPDWENEPPLQTLRQKARRLIRRFDGREPWAWKDPRNSLTLPFWRALLPEMKILICVRNPLAVAESLWLRDGIPYADSFDLWLTYNQRVLAAAPPDSRLITHSDRYLHQPHDELRRVLRWCGLFTTEPQRERACQHIRPFLVHHHKTVDDLTRLGATSKLLRCYHEVCAEAEMPWRQTIGV